MFGIPGKQAVSITDKAAIQIAKLMAKEGNQGLRIGVKKGGCAGMEYTMDYVADVDPLDEVVEQELVSGIAYSRDEAKITLVKVADKPGVAARI